MLYAGKVSGVLVTLLFIPLYSRELGATQFGIIAVILSMQALLITLDFGLATQVGRELADSNTSANGHLQMILNAEVALVTLYLALFAAAFAALDMGLLGQTHTDIVLLTLVLFGLMVLQNLYYSAILARRAYSAASMIQLLGNLCRAAATAAMLVAYSATVQVFVVTQMVVALFHAGITRWYCFRQLAQDAELQGRMKRPQIEWMQSVALIRQGKSLVLFSIAGAAVMQLDKPIILYYMSAASVAPYYLAMSVCMVPISILASPVAQYFQPQMINAIAGDDSKYTLRVMQWFTVIIVTATLLPSCIVWLNRDLLIDLWLGTSKNNLEVSNFVGILLPGVVLGAIGFLPYTLLLAKRDYKYQGYASSLMSGLTLTGAAIAASLNAIEWVCLIYAMYHAASTLVSWHRAIQLETTRKLAIVGIEIASAISIPVVILVYMVTLWT
jgi:O-antigen/teichoic acid export membrane protein